MFCNPNQYTIIIGGATRLSVYWFVLRWNKKPAESLTRLLLNRNCSLKRTNIDVTYFADIQVYRSFKPNCLFKVKINS